MGKWRVVVTRSFERDFRGLEHDIQGRVLDALEVLENDPYRGRKLAGVKIGRWRKRVGDYRIRYDVEGEDVVLYRVRHRRLVYGR